MSASVAVICTRCRTVDRHPKHDSRSPSGWACPECDWFSFTKPTVPGRHPKHDPQAPSGWACPVCAAALVASGS
jgi:hypothetical protein